MPFNPSGRPERATDPRICRVCPTLAALVAWTWSPSTKSIRQKDPDSQVSSTVGIGARAWPLLFPEADIPEGLTAFEAMSDGDRSFPSTPVTFGRRGEVEPH